MNQPAVTHYSVHGVNIALASATVPLAAVHARLRSFPRDGATPPDLRFDFHSVAEHASHVVPTPPRLGRPVYQAPNGDQIWYEEQANQLFIDYADRVRVLGDLNTGRITTSVRDPEPANRWLVSHPLFTIPLVELLKQRGCYSLHAAGLSLAGRGLLIAGTSGAGKSTLTLALLRAGFGFLGDDTVFLIRAATGLRVLAFPDEIDVTEATAQMFSELNFLLAQPRPAGYPKWPIRAEDIFHVAPTWQCTPAVIIFPRIGHCAQSTLTPLARDQALLELVPNVLLTEPRSSQAHLDLLGELVRHTDCYQLETGRDFDAVAALLRRTLGNRV